VALAEVLAPELPGFREVAARARPLTLARDRHLPVLPALAPLLPEAGLRR
jgi:hypothetical protein